MSKVTITKWETRKAILLARTAEIFGASENEAREFFGPRKRSLTMLDEQANDLIQKGVQDGSLTKIPWAKDAYIIESEKSIYTNSPQATLGYIYLQNASSLLPPLALNPQPGEKLLDMCVAPGGKTILLAKLSNGLADITVNDESRTRLAITKRLFSRLAIPITAYYTQPAQYLAKLLPPESFDKILVDAPCSGEGLINLAQPKSLTFWSLKKVKRLSNLQKLILAQAEKLLKPGGLVVYSTCTLAPEENEEVVDWAVKKLGLIPQKLDLADLLANATAGLDSWKGKTYSPECKNCVRIKPNSHMEPFFLCLMTKTPHRQRSV